jgi:hypothetical protein
LEYVASELILPLRTTQTTASEEDALDIELSNQVRPLCKHSQRQAYHVETDALRSVVNVTSSFLREKANLEEAVGCVAEVTMPLDAQLKELNLSSVSVTFSDDTPGWIVQHDPSMPWKEVVPVVGPQSEATKANLRFFPGAVLQLAGKVAASTPSQIQVSRDRRSKITFLKRQP